MGEAAGRTARDRRSRSPRCSVRHGTASGGTVMSRRSVGILAAAGALAASVAISVPASAEVAHRTCPKGAFCAYSGDWETGRVLLATQGNWSGTIYNVQSTFNNGYRDPGADHV